MSRRIICAAAIGCALALGACTPATQPGQSVLDIIGSTSPTAADVVADVKIGCGIVVDYADVASLLTAGVPGVSSAPGIAKLLCQGFNAKVTVARRGGSRKVATVVNGVVVRGARQ